MKGLECPYCKKEVLRLWELFIFISPFWLTRTCRNCSNTVKFDFNVVIQIMFSIILGVIFGRIVNIFISVDFILFNAFLLISFAYIPFLLGKKLFINNKNCHHKKTNRNRR